MAGPVSQAESQVYYRRLVNAAKAFQDVYEEVLRLRSENVTFDLATNLDDEAGGILTKAEAGAFFAVLQDFTDFYENVDVSADGVAGSSDRRDKVNPFIAAEPLI